MQGIMSIDPAKVELLFVLEFTSRDAFEAQSRGYLSHVLVALNGVELYPVTFYDAVRLGEDLEESAKHGRAFVADPGMIVLQEVTLPAMQTAVRKLSEEGFFSHLLPVTEEQLANANPYHWPP